MIFSTISVLEVSDDLGTGIAGIIKAAKSIYTAAHGLRDAYSVYKTTAGAHGGGIAKDIAIEGGKAIGEGSTSGKTVHTSDKELGGHLPLESATAIHQEPQSLYLGPKIEPCIRFY